MALILYCEDDPVGNKSITRLLRLALPLSVTVISAMSLEEALQKAKLVITELAVVITDGNLGCDGQGNPTYGCQLVEELKKLGYYGKAIRCSGTDLPSNKKGFFDKDIEKGSIGSCMQLVETVKTYLRL